MAEGKITITIAAVDRLTAPARMMNQAAAKLVVPFVHLNKQLGGAAEILGRDLGVTALGDRFKALGGSAVAVGGQVSGLAGAVLDMAGLGGLSLPDLAAGLGRGVVEASAQAEQYEAVLTSLLGSSARAEESMAWIDTFAEKTPFGVDAVTDAFIRLKTMGIDPADGTLQAVGDAAAATGRPLAQMVDAMAAAAGGKLDRLRDVAGGRVETKEGKVTYTVADKDGKQQVFTAAENDARALQAMVMQVFQAKSYAGAMDNLSRTWNAMWLRLSDARSGFLQMIGDAGAFDHLKDKLRAVLGLINQWKADGTLQAWAKRISDAFTGAMQAIEGKLAGVNWAQAFTTATDAVSRFVDTVRSVVAWLGGWENAVILVAFVMNAGLLASVLQLGMALGGLAAGFVRVGASLAMMAVGNVVAGIGAAVGAAGNVILALRAGYGVVAAFNLVLAANPFGLFLLAAAAVAGVAYLMWENWATVGPFLGQVWEGITSIFAGAVDAIIFMLVNFNPAVLVARAINAVVLQFTGIDLFAVGAEWIDGLWAGIKGKWAGLTAWLSDALAGLTGWLPDWARDKLGITAPAAPPPVPAVGGPSAVSGVAKPPARTATAAILAKTQALASGAATPEAVAQAADPTPAAGIPAGRAAPWGPPLGAMAAVPVSQISAPVTVAVTVNGMADIDVLRREVEGATRRAMEEWQWRQQSAAGAALWGGV